MQLAVIKHVGFGCRDIDECCLWFTAHTSEHEASLQVFDLDTAKKIIEAYQVYEVHDLEGKVCWVDVNGMSMRFIKAAIIK